MEHECWNKILVDYGREREEKEHDSQGPKGLNGDSPRETDFEMNQGHRDRPKREDGGPAQVDQDRGSEARLLD